MLVLANDDGGLYSELQNAWRRYMTSSPQIDCYFIKGRTGQSEPTMLEGDSLYIQIKEGYGEIPWQKTMAALRYFEPRFKDYAFVYRTNLSSHLHFPKYLEFCKTLPRSGLCAAFINTNHGYRYPSGAGFTISTDLAKRLIDDPPQHYIMDDVTVGVALAKWGIPIRAVPRIDFPKSILESEILSQISRSDPRAFHFRIKTADTHRLITDMAIHQFLYKRHYEVRIPLPT